MADSSSFAIAACCTSFVSHVVRTSATTPAFNVNSFSLTFTLWRCTFTHLNHLGGGEIRTTLSPRTIIKPSFLWLSTSVVSSVSSRTKLRCWSKPFSLPRRLFPPFNRTSTIFPRFCSRISVVISLIIDPSYASFSSILKLIPFKLISRSSENKYPVETNFSPRNVRR